MWKPASTFSSSVSCLKRRIFWKVRAMPSRTRRCAGKPIRFFSSKYKDPASGWYRPESRLSSVDLPAPFGPISAKIDFSATPIETFCTARTPPKLLLIPLARKIIAAVRAMPSTLGPCRRA